MKEELKEIKNFKYNINVLLNDPVFQTKFTEENSPDKSMWMNEARAYLVYCINKINKVLETKE